MIKADTFIHAVHIQISLSETVNGQKVTIFRGQKVTFNILGLKCNNNRMSQYTFHLYAEK